MIIFSLLTFAIASSADIVIYPSKIVSGNGGSCSGCPGKYAGYVNYSKTVAQGYGWKPDTNATSWTATDTNRSNTKVQVEGAFSDINCGATKVSVSPTPPGSPAYRFTVYFTNSVPLHTNDYPLVLHGFLP